MSIEETYVLVTEKPFELAEVTIDPGGKKTVKFTPVVKDTP